MLVCSFDAFIDDDSLQDEKKGPSSARHSMGHIAPDSTSVAPRRRCRGASLLLTQTLCQVSMACGALGEAASYCFGAALHQSGFLEGAAVQPSSDARSITRSAASRSRM